MLTNDDAILEWFQAVQDEIVDIEIAGRLFGGRRGEAPQYPSVIEIANDQIIIRFKDRFMTLAYPVTHIERVRLGTELLTIIHPRGFISNLPLEITISDADIVMFGCHFNDNRPQTPDNWCEFTYRFYDDMVHLSATGPCPEPHDIEFKRNHVPAVRLLLNKAWIRSQR